MHSGASGGPSPRDDWSRRRFLAAAVVPGSLLAVSGGLHPLRGLLSATAAGPLRLGLILPGADVASAHAEAISRGVGLGVAEAERAAELFGRGIELRVVKGDALEVARRLAERERVTAILGGLDDESCGALSDLAEARKILFLNVACRADALRGERCGRYTFHVEASEAMYAGALAEWREAEKAVVDGPAADPIRPLIWHHTLGRYGAAQLNDRFRARFGEPMAPGAWAGWMAVKVAWEAALRARTLEPAALAAALERLRFDGHKGRSLTFRRWDHQLRQPLYLLGEDGQVLGEAPRAAPGREADSRELLDRLSHTEQESRCAWNDG